MTAHLGSWDLRMAGGWMCDAYCRDIVPRIGPGPLASLQPLQRDLGYSRCLTNAC